MEHENRRLPITDANAHVYIRPISPTEIEYKVAKDPNGESLCQVGTIKFEEGKR